MNGEIINNSTPAKDGEIVRDTVSVGDKIVPIQIIQHIYNEITGKSEKVSKSYTDDTLIEMSDIENLYGRFCNALEQYHVDTKNCDVTLYYTNDTNDHFSSFERFKMHNSGASASVESVLIKYNFMVILPIVQKVQTFSITMRFVSRIALEKRMLGDFFAAPPKMVALMGRRTAFIEIEHVDYMVARNFLHIFDEWHKTIPKSDPQPIIEFLQNKSHWIPRILPLITVIFVSFIIFREVDSFIEETSLITFAKFGIISMCGVYFSRIFSVWIAQTIEDHLDLWSKISYIKITRGDNIAIDDANNQNRKILKKAAIRTIFSFMLMIVVKIIAAVIVAYLGIK